MKQDYETTMHGEGPGVLQSQFMHGPGWALRTQPRTDRPVPLLPLPYHPAGSEAAGMGWYPGYEDLPEDRRYPIVQCEALRLSTLGGGIFSCVQPSGPPWGFTRVLAAQPRGPYTGAHGVKNVGLSIKAQAMGPEGALAQMSFYIFMWNVITFGHDRGRPVTAIRAFMVLRGIRVFGDTCSQLKATGCAESRNYCKAPGARGWMGDVGSVVERELVSAGPGEARPRDGPLRRDNWLGSFHQLHQHLPWHSTVRGVTPQHV